MIAAMRGTIPVDVTPSAPPPELPRLHVPDAAAWEQWLTEHHDAAGVWLLLAKKAGGGHSPTYAEAVERALCFGWIDGQVRRLDEAYFQQRFTPRGPRSRWSEINVAKAQALIAAGRMRPPGQAAIDAARADGRWAQAYAPQSTATVPDDMQAALDADPAARDFFATLTGSRRYAFLHRLAGVRTEAGRARRIAAYVERLREGRTLDDS